MIPPTPPPVVLAIDIGGTSTKLALVSSTGQLTGWRSFPTKPPLGEFLGRLRTELADLDRNAPKPPVGLAAAVAGFLAAPGTLSYNPNLPWLEGVDLHAALRSKLPTQFENDANAAAAGELLFGAGAGSHRFLSVTGGTGLGVAMLVGGDLLRVAHGCLGDAGHIVVAPGGPACTCGGHGCAEALLATATLANTFAERTGREQTFRNLVDATAAANPAALAITDLAGQHLGIALASLTHIFFPDRISISGGLSALGTPLLNAAELSFRAHVGHMPGADVTLMLARTGTHATLQGAAACFFLDRSNTAASGILTAHHHATTT